MSNYPLFAAIILAIVDWIAVEKKLKTVEYIAKPATMLALLWWLGSNVGLGGSVTWFTLGILFCLAGDIFLMLPRDMFIFGLLAFFVGQIFYVVGFNNNGPFFNILGGVLIVVLGIYIGWLYPRLVMGLAAMGKIKLKIPVLIYALAISLMVYSAFMTWTRPGWSMYAAISASLGALLFYVSDSILAWDRFVSPITHARLKTMVTYHLGQLGIILSAILHITQQ